MVTRRNRFFYVHSPNIDRNSHEYVLDNATVLYKLGQNPKDLNIIFSRKNNPEIKINREDYPIARPIGTKYIFGGIYTVGDFVDYYYAPFSNLNEGEIKWKPLYKVSDRISDFWVNNDSVYLLSAKGASNFRILKNALKNFDLSKSQIVVPENESTVITDIALNKNGLYYVKNKNGVEANLYCKDFHGNKIKRVKTPPSGHIDLITQGYKSDNLWIETQHWISKRKRYRFNYSSEIFKEENLEPPNLSFSLEDVIVEEIEVPSHDGKMIPLSLIHKKDIELNSRNRLFITGYGSYGFSIIPRLNDFIRFWVAEGGVYAIAHVRGGGEKGDEWYLDGKKANKPNTWKDFISCTEYLTQKKYTTPDRIFTRGVSAGGILIGRAITERPDLFKAAYINVGSLNASRNEFGPAGPNNITEFGTVKDSLDFKALLEMDAYQHIKEGTAYPALLLTSGLNDMRIAVWGTGKFAARMLQANASKNPILLSVDSKGGHGFDATQEKRNQKTANVLAFALWQTGHPDYQPQE